jgi:RNA polymerase sigma factor for flagellar operon FliA
VTSMRAQYPEQQHDVEQLINDHLGLVKKIAWHMYGRVGLSVEIEDLVQIGYYGLVLAAQNYVVKEGATFASYAGMRIRGEIVDYLRKNSNLCRTTIKMQQRTRKAEEKLRNALGCEPKRHELATELAMDEAELMDWEKAFQANTHLSLDSVYDEFSVWFVSGEDNPEEVMGDIELRELLKVALKTLPEREALVIQLYYVEELNVYEIAEVLDLTTGRVSQIKKSAIMRLRDSLKSETGGLLT